MLTKKERQRVRQEKKKKSESRDVLIKGNSEGLDQIILHNLVREDTVFDSEKMKMTCPQRAIPTEQDLSVIVEVIDCNHRGMTTSPVCLHSGRLILCGSAGRPRIINTVKLKTLNPTRDNELEGVMTLNDCTVHFTFGRCSAWLCCNRNGTRKLSTLHHLTPA